MTQREGGSWWSSTICWLAFVMEIRVRNRNVVMDGMHLSHVGKTKFTPVLFSMRMYCEFDRWVFELLDIGTPLVTL